VYQTTPVQVIVRVEADAAAHCGSESKGSEMVTGQISGVIQHLRRTVLLRDGAGLTDGQLLEDYISRHDEAALAALVRRHGPMVWGVCRRVLHNYHDAEDAFQATFLVLVRKAASIVPRGMVANWLYGVAHQTALKARATAAKRKGRERQVKEMPEPAIGEQELWHDLQLLLDEELSRLPDKYRAVIVLCDLEGKTRKQAAGQLGVPEGTVAGQLARARVMLAKRLAQRGVGLSGGALAAVLSQKVAAAGVPPLVVTSTIKAASLFAAGQAAATGVISVKVAALTEGVLKTMLLTKLKVAMAVVLLAALALCGVGVVTHTTTWAVEPQPPKVDRAAEADGASTTICDGKNITIEWRGQDGKVQHRTLQIKEEEKEDQKEDAKPNALTVRDAVLKKIDGDGKTVTATVETTNLRIDKESGKDFKLRLIDKDGEREIKGFWYQIVKGQTKLVDVPVAMEAKITDGKKEIGVTDLKAEMRVTLQLTVRDNQITVISIATGDKKP
jgi:RNA polymerase sigma factor (sigma-70 family)